MSGMSWTKKTNLLIALCFFLLACGPKTNRSAPIPSLLSIGEFEDLKKTGIPFILLDIRAENLVSQGHIPGALSLDRNLLSNHDLEVKGMMANPNQISEVFKLDLDLKLD